MPSNRKVLFRVTKEQYERILNNANAKGFVTISSYLRDLSLSKAFVIESKIFENNKFILENNKLIRDVIEMLKKRR